MFVCGFYTSAGWLLCSRCAENLLIKVVSKMWKNMMVCSSDVNLNSVDFTMHRICNRRVSSVVTMLCSVLGKMRYIIIARHRAKNKVF